MKKQQEHNSFILRRFSAIAASKRLLVLGIAMLFIAILSAVIVLHVLPVRTQDNFQEIYQKAQKECGDELWIIGEDLGSTVMYVKSPYPSNYVGEEIQDYACDEKTANEIAQRLDRQSTVSFGVFIVVVAGMYLLGAGGVLLIAVWTLAHVILRIQRFFDHKTTN